MVQQKSPGEDTLAHSQDQGEGVSWRVCDMPERMRPREEVDRVGVENVSDDVLLALILRSGSKGKNVVELARDLLAEYGSLSAIAGTSVGELSGRDGRRRKRWAGMGRVKAQMLMAALELGKRMTEESGVRKRCIKSPADAVALLRTDAAVLDREVFWVIHLDAKNQIKGRPIDVTNGLLDASLVHPREIFKEAIRCSAAAVVLAHNHPSGDPTPSSEDIRITKQLVEAGRIIGIKVLDHVILGRCMAEGMPGYLSVRETGSVEFG